MELASFSAVASDDALTVLCFDDSEAVLTLMTWVLTDHGYKALAAQTAKEAAAAVASCDLVIVDFHMPQIKANDALSLLKPLAGVTLFYLYTADSFAEGSFKALGFDGVFVDKGDITLLPRQVDVAARRLRLRRFKAPLAE